MIVDLYAGAGGWDLGARWAGIPDPTGIELDPDACATRTAVGMPTIQADVTTVPVPLGMVGLIASPPCPAFSAAGNKDGHDDIADLCALFVHDEPPQPWAHPDSALIADLARWVDHPALEWVLLEQVPEVLPVWEAIAHRLQARGWVTARAWIVKAETFGVPQTRRRAIMLAHRTRPVDVRPTHHAYRPGVARDTQTGDLFDTLEPWVSMAEALGWDALNTGRDWQPGGDRADAQVIPGDRSAPSVTAKSIGQWQLRAASPTSTYGKTRRPITEPAPTVLAGAIKAPWAWERPATTVTTDPRVWPPGHKYGTADIDRLGIDEARRRYVDDRGTDGVRCEPWELAVLQSFPHHYPFHGTRTARGRQIGNAVPPLLAKALIGAVAS